MTAAVNIVRLSDKGFPMNENVECTAVGWGEIDVPLGRYNTRLHKLKVVSSMSAKACPGLSDGERMNIICLQQNDGKGLCDGDSGGPLICHGREGPRPSVGASRLVTRTPDRVRRQFVGSRRIVRYSPSGVQRNIVRIRTARFGTLRHDRYHAHLHVCVPVPRLDTSLRLQRTENAAIVLLGQQLRTLLFGYVIRVRPRYFSDLSGEMRTGPSRRSGRDIKTTNFSETFRRFRNLKIARTCVSPPSS